MKKLFILLLLTISLTGCFGVSDGPPQVCLQSHPETYTYTYFMPITVGKVTSFIPIPQYVEETVCDKWGTK